VAPSAKAEAGISLIPLEVFSWLVRFPQQETSSSSRYGNSCWADQEEEATRIASSRWKRVYSNRRDSKSGFGDAVRLRAMDAQLVPAAEIHWCLPCGNPLSL